VASQKPLPLELAGTIKFKSASAAPQRWTCFSSQANQIAEAIKAVLSWPPPNSKSLIFPHADDGGPSTTSSSRQG